jgi:hypothetical protein
MDLIVPVYLNQRLVFDLVAMTQNGIATVTQVSNYQESSSTKSSAMSTSFGLSDAFATLLKIDLSGQKSTGSDDGTATSSSEERIHTPSSLFFSLRQALLEKGTVKNLGEDKIQSGDFVEFEAALKRSPMIEGLDAMIQLLEMARLFTEPEPLKKGQKPKQNELQKLGGQLTSLADGLKQGESRDLVATDLSNSYSAVLTVDEQYLSDPTMSDVVDGTFKVLGKVVRHLTDSTDSISLLRKTALAHAPDVLSKFLAAFENLDSDIFALPEMKTEIEGPALQILPIAIFS